VANTLVGGVQTKVIQSNVVNARAIYNNSPGEGLWDPLFREAVVAQLASAFAMALFRQARRRAGRVRHGQRDRGARGIEG
jgi:hypothetical protein